MELVTEKRKAFRDGLKTDFYRTTKFDVNNKELFTQAVRDGYGDAKRTFKKIGDFWQDKDEEKKNFFEEIAESIQNVFCKEIPDEWHEKLCRSFCNELTALGYCPVIDGQERTVTYGQAQKVINMAFKYLFCTDGAEGRVFEMCHMPLDSYTLSWYRKISGKDAVIKADATWSGLDEDLYKKLQKEIRKHLERGCQIEIDNEKIQLPKQPLYAECIIWPEEILLKVGNDFMKTLDPDYKRRTSDSMQLMKYILKDQLPKYCNLDIHISEKV